MFFIFITKFIQNNLSTFVNKCQVKKKYNNYLTYNLLNLQDTITFLINKINQKHHIYFNNNLLKIINKNNNNMCSVEKDEIQFVSPLVDKKPIQPVYNMDKSQQQRNVQTQHGDFRTVDEENIVVLVRCNSPPVTNAFLMEETNFFWIEPFANEEENEVCNNWYYYFLYIIYYYKQKTFYYRHIYRSNIQ